MSTQWIPFYQTISNQTAFIAMGGGGTTGQTSTTEANEQAPMAAPGSFTAIRVDLSAAPGVGASYRFQLSVNGTASSTLNLLISDTTTSGVLTATQAVVAGDLVTLKVTATSAPATVTLNAWLAFQPTTTDNFCYFSGSAVNLISSAPIFQPLLYGVSDDSTGAGTDGERFRAVSPLAGTISTFYVCMATAPGGANSWTVIINQNGSEVAASSLVISGASKTGSLTGLSITVAKGDYLSFKIKTDSTATNTRGFNAGVCFTPTVSGTFAIGTANNGASQSVSAANYALVGQTNQNSIQYNATETNRQRLVPATFTFTDLYIRGTTAPGAAKSYQYDLRQNVSSPGLTVTISGAVAVTGNASGSISMVTADLLAFLSTPTGTPSALGAQNWGFAVVAATGGASASYTTFGVITREHDTTKDAPTTAYYFEAFIAATGTDTAHARLYNVTDGAAVSGSDVTTTSASATRVRSSAITLASGSKVYRAEFGGISDGNTYTCYGADIIADVSA